MVKHRCKSNVGQENTSRIPWGAHHVLLIHIMHRQRFHGHVKAAQMPPLVQNFAVVLKVFMVLLISTMNPRVRYVHPVVTVLVVQRMLNVLVNVHQVATALVVQQMINVLVFAKQELTRMLDPQIA